MKKAPLTGLFLWISIDLFGINNSKTLNGFARLHTRPQTH